MGCVLEDGIDCIAPRKHGGDSGRCSKEYDKQNYSISHRGHSGLCPGIAHHLLRKIRNKPIATIVNDPRAKMRGLSIGMVSRKFELSRRRDNLSFKHHREVASLSPIEADALLEIRQA
jgi:hypothetical protein